VQRLLKKKMKRNGEKHELAGPRGRETPQKKGGDSRNGDDKKKGHDKR